MTDGLRGKLTSYGDPEFSQYLRKAFLHASGFSAEDFEKPIVGITNTHSDYNSCHGTVPDLIERVSRGVLASGGIPMVFPTITIHESFANPTSMLFRNLMAMDTEEMILAQPMDSVVLIGGCDKTLPAQIMAAISADTPAIVLPVGPMSTGEFKGRRMGACTDCRDSWAKYRAGEIDKEELDAINAQLAPTMGTCMVMGTASTMAVISETVGLTLQNAATIPAMNSERKRLAQATGACAVKMAKAGGPLPRDLITEKSLRNAQILVHAIGGSTNALIHLAAFSRRAGMSFSLKEFDELGQKTPMIVDLKPSGTKYMQDLHAAGGLMRVVDNISHLIDMDLPTVDGKSFSDRLAKTDLDFETTVVCPADKPLQAQGAIAVLTGNLAPRGAIIKHAAASKSLLKHTGRAVIFNSIDDMVARIDDPELDVEENDVLVLRNAGLKGSPGMPEAGSIPIPKKLSRKGVRDMVRISDARMSGTGYGTVILHVTPESAEGGPISKLRDGDIIELDVANRSLNALVSDAEFAKRVPQIAEAFEMPSRGYKRLYMQHVNQADEGGDFDFLVDPDNSQII